MRLGLSSQWTRQRTRRASPSIAGIRHAGTISTYDELAQAIAGRALLPGLDQPRPARPDVRALAIVTWSMSAGTSAPGLGLRPEARGEILPVVWDGGPPDSPKGAACP